MFEYLITSKRPTCLSGSVSESIICEFCLHEKSNHWLQVTCGLGDRPTIWWQVIPHLSSIWTWDYHHCAHSVTIYVNMLHLVKFSKPLVPGFTTMFVYLA